MHEIFPSLHTIA